MLPSPSGHWLLIDQGIYFIVSFEDGRWRRQVAPHPAPVLPLITAKEMTMPPVQTAPADTSVFTADLRREAARAAIEKLAATKLDPIAPILAWMPDAVRNLMVVAALRFLAANPSLLTVANLTPKQITAVKALADDAYSTVAGPILGNWLRKIGPTLKGALKIYDPSTDEKKGSATKDLVKLIRAAVTEPRDGDEGEDEDADDAE